MSRVLFARAEHCRTHSTWAVEGRIPDFKVIVLVCPECNKACLLSKKIHSVDKDGVVSPSLVCPHKDCHFHAMIKLEGWTEPDPRTR